MATEQIATERLMTAIFGKSFDSSFPRCYPYIVIEKGREKKVLTLTEALEEALNALPLTRGKKDLEKWGRLKRIVELRFAPLEDGKMRSFRAIGREFGVTGTMVQQIEVKALRLLRHPRRSRKLRKFLVPSPEEMAEKDKELEELENELEELRRELWRLEERLEERQVESKHLAETGRHLDDYEALEVLSIRFPNTRVWNTIRRCSEISGLSKLRTMVKSGDIRYVSYIGPASIEFLKKALEEELKGGDCGAR